MRYVEFPFDELIEPGFKKDARQYWHSFNLGLLFINNIFFEVLDQLNKEQPIDSERMDQFAVAFNNLSNQSNGMALQYVLLNLIFSIGVSLENKYRVEVEGAIAIIDASLKAGKAIPQQQDKTEQYIALVNTYQLLTHLHQKTERNSQSNLNIVACYQYGSPLYPGVYSYFRYTVNTLIPFAINALTLTGMLRSTSLVTPIYPFDFQIQDECKISSRRGIKISQDYYPYKKVYKLYKGDTGDKTFAATNGQKILYLRGVKKENTMSVMASKIASMVSPQHFASERLLDNKIAGSRELPAYVVSVVDPTITRSRKKHVEEDRVIFPGTGMIDEVCNYIVECDPNNENFGFSSMDLADSHTHLSKIDYDRCMLSKKSSKDDYEHNILTRPFSIYRAHSEQVLHHESYIKEKLYARLKVSMLTRTILQGMAKKSFAEPDEMVAQNVIDACVARSDIAFELFLDHSYASSYLQAHASIVQQCYKEVVAYLMNHFEPQTYQKMISSLDERIIKMNADIELHLGIKSQNASMQAADRKVKTNHGMFYRYYVDNASQGRPHNLTVSAQKLDPHSSLRFFKGDHLKSRILEELKTEISCTASEDELREWVKNIPDDPRYKVLQRGQGIPTRLLKLKTSSIIALEGMIEEQWMFLNQMNLLALGGNGLS